MRFTAAAFVHDHRDRIIRTWETLVLANEGGAKLQGSVLRGRLPALLEDLADWLEHGEVPGTEQMRSVARRHALAALESSYDLPLLIREFQCLRETILSLLLTAQAVEQEAGSGGIADRVLELVRLNAGLDGAITGIVELFVEERDRRIDEARRSEELLEQRYRTLFESIDEGFCIVEVLFDGATPVDYRFLEVNPAFGHHTGIASAVGRRMREIAPEHEEHWFRTYGRVAVTGQSVRFESAARALGRFYDVYAFRVGAPQQRRVAILFNDITARKRAEEALLEADRHKTEFLAILSHELRNPLAPIRNAIFLLERAAPGTHQAIRAREVLHRQSEHLTRLVDDLLDVTRISRGKVELRRARIDLRDVVRKTTDDLRSLFEESALELRVEHPAGPVWVDGDATRLAQVLGNLLHNAAKFTSSGGDVAVGVSAGDGWAMLSVRDSGAGMEPDQVERMFEPFAQGAQGAARSKGGLGLGLALVKGLVELHGGSVRATTAGVGQGAEFVVTLPLAGVGSSPAHPPECPGLDRPGLLVLVVEDNADAGRTLADVLELEGHRVRVARDGRSGFALARELRPDVILCDIGLPDMDGYDFARAARGDPDLARTRLIALTGYAQPEDRERARAAGFDAHVTKPPPLDELKALVRGAVDE